jgi:aminomethyltransferase
MMFRCDPVGSDREIGRVTSGGVAPSLASKPIALAYVDKEFSKLNEKVHAIVRGKKVEGTISKTPFVPNKYYRDSK